MIGTHIGNSYRIEYPYGYVTLNYSAGKDALDRPLRPLISVAVTDNYGNCVGCVYVVNQLDQFISNNTWNSVMCIQLAEGVYKMAMAGVQ